MSNHDLSDILCDDRPASSTLPATVHERELATLLGITRQAVGEHVRNGILTRSGRARFDLEPSVAAYCRHLRAHAARAGRPAVGGEDLKAERLRLTRAQAEAQELKNQNLTGELVDAQAVAREWQTILRDVRAAMLAVPSRFGAVMAHLDQDDIAALDREIRDVLEGLADADA